MKNLIVILLFSLSALPAFADSIEIAAKILKVTDGDTVRLKILKKKDQKLIAASLSSSKRKSFVKKYEISVRMVNHDTPESVFRVKGKQIPHEINVGTRTINIGKEATKELQSMVEIGSNVIAVLGDAITGKYGRLLAEIHLQDGTNTNLEMVRRGFSVPFLFEPLPSPNKIKAYWKAYNTAKSERLGLWSLVDDPADLEEPTGFRSRLSKKDDVPYVGDRKSKRAYPYACRSVIDVQKRVYFVDETVIDDTGYRFSSRCKRKKQK